uniref:RRM domain-containing protein n=1 Tax=Anopheles minimus TaxID=112268 RepID=A0A182W342_9DIPT
MCRFQYEIPTVGQHYGNAFHLAEDDEEVRDFIVERHHYGSVAVHNLSEEHIVGDDDEEEDIEMSTAVEVISIDPNCDYDTDEEEDDDDDVEEEDNHENETESEGVQEYEDGEEFDESRKDLYQAQTSAVHNSGEVNEMCSDHIAGSHCQHRNELMETADRSRSRNGSNTDCSSTNSSSRDSSTSSSTYSNSNANRQAEEQAKDVTMHQRHQYSYHSEDGAEDEENEEEDEDDDDDPDLEFSLTKNTLWELPAKLLQDKSGSKKSKAQPHGRRKRCSSSQRQSFSMPHSPVGAGKIDSEGVNSGGLLPTSLSFDDLDSLVCDLSPMKNVSLDKAATSGVEDEDLLVDPLVVAANFDLTAYITGDDTIVSQTNTKRLANGSRYQNNGATQRNVESPVRVLPRSRGKELKVLRQHMLPREHQHTIGSPSNTFEETEPLSNGKRDSATKAVRKLTIDDESSEDDDKHIAIAQAHSKRADYRNELRGVRKPTKRKIVDDTDKDPTWNPNGGSSSKTKSETKLSNQKHGTTIFATSSGGVEITASATNKHLVVSSRGSGGNSEEVEKVLPKPPPVMVKKGTKFGQVIKTETSSAGSQNLGLCKKSHSNATPKSVAAKIEGRDHHAHTNVHRKKTNVKLDHDYCSPKRGSHMHSATGGNVSGTLSAASGQQRKTIEIPFLLPTKEQLRQERKLQKEKKRSEQLVAAKKPQLQSDVTCTDSDNGKDKQVQHNRSCTDNGSVSVASKAQKIATSLNGPLSSVKHSPSTIERNRTDVNKTCVNTIATGGSSVCQSEVRSVEVKKSVLPYSAGGGGVKRQISLLKINQPTAAVTIPTEGGAGVTSHVSISTQVKIDDTTISSSTAAATNETTSRQCVEAGSHKQEAEATGLTTQGVGESKSKHEVVVRKKLNLQEYKKRREHPESTPEGGPKATKEDPQQQTTTDNRNNDSSVNCTNGYSSSKVPALNDVVKVKPEQAIVKQNTLSVQCSKSVFTITEPLDPISAAKMKALRMQQLKKEAAIKSNEVKLSQKTIPLLPILPLAQITSLEFDEHGNPLPVDDAKVRQRVTDGGAQDASKLHPDYEEIIIVSIGCNTSLTITPAEKDTQTMADQVSMEHDRQHNAKHGSGCEKEASRLMNISDTIKRCCPSVDTMPFSSLIASIQEVMIKKSNISTSTNGTTGGTGAPQTVQIGAEASIAEGAVTLKVETMPNAAATVNNTGAGEIARDHQYVLHQSSPYVGVSPPSSFSPGKPERAHTTNVRAVTDKIVHSPSKQTRSSKTPVDGTQTHSYTGTEFDTNVTPVVEHGEDKVIMHLRKDRIRAQRIDAASQTEPCGRFPPLCKLAPVRVSTCDQNQSGDNSQDCKFARQRELQKRTERRSYRRHHRRNGSESPSGAESDAADRPSSRSKSHQNRLRARDRHSRSSHSRSRSRHRSARRRSSCSSGSRSRSRSGYSRVVHHSHYHTQQQQHGINGNGGSGCNNISRYSRSRRKSRTCSRSSSSTSASRYGSRGRRSLSSSSTSSMSTSGTSDDGGHGAVHFSRSRSRSPRSRSRSGIRSSTPDRHRYHSREHLSQHRRAISPERNIVYVGRIEGTARKEDIQQKFQSYGKIVKITLHLKANGSRYGFVTFEKPQHAYDAIDACGTDPNLRNYDVSFGGRRAFCRTQYADLDGEVSNDLEHQIPYVTLDGSLLLPARGPMISYSVPPVCHKEPTYGAGALTSGGGMGESFDDLLKKFKKEIGARKT